MTSGHDQHQPATGRIVALSGHRSPHRLPHALAAVGLTVGASTASTASQAATDAAAGSPAGVVFGIGFVVLALGVIGALYRHASRLRAETTLLQQRQAQHAALTRLLDVWHWRTDGQHRLLACVMPNGHSLSTGADAATVVWTRFSGIDPLTGEPCTTRQAGLRQRLEAQQAIDDLPVGCLADSGTLHVGTLRALPLHDAAGVFVGHVGTLREQALSAGTPAAVPAAAAPPTAATTGSPSAPASATSPVDRDASMPSMTPLAIPGEPDAESFSYTVSHDLRAPLRVVEGFTKIVKEDYGRLLDRVGNDHLDRVLGAAARMNSMIDALLALSQLSAKPVSRQPVNLSQLAGFVVDDLRRQSPQHAVTVHIDPGMQVQGDPTLLRVVLENLLGNAWKYTGKCAEPQVWFERCADTATPSFTVRDNGAGFDMRYADRLFGVFQRLHSASEFQGTGIGLASVRRIVHKHGGEVWADSEVGRGASFHFSLAPPPL